MLEVYNTLTRKKEIFKPKNSENVKIYYCGPTVYNYAQIGNFRTYIFEDIIIRTLQFLGYKTNTTMNITDVDDKTIRESQKAKMSLSDFTKRYTDIFLSDIEKLGIKKADNIIPVTSLIDEMVAMINTLLKKWFAYISEDGSVYFETCDRCPTEMDGVIRTPRHAVEEWRRVQNASALIWLNKNALTYEKWINKFKTVS